MEIIGLDIKKAARAIKEGRILICPTDTVYGLICDASNPKAVQRLYQIKKRPNNKPVPVFVSSIEMAKKIAKINPKQEKFLKQVWPGKITAILKPRRKFPKGIGKSKKEIGLRIPSRRFVLSLAKHIGPLAESSANISGMPASTKIKEVLKQFALRRGSGQEGKRYQPDLVIDVGDLPPSRPSQVIDLRVLPPKILRT